MRGLYCVTLLGAVLVGAEPVYADVQSYCAAYGADIADMRLTGESILNATAAPQLTEAQRASAAEAATRDCLDRFAPQVKAQAPLKAKPAAISPTASPAPQPGSAEWNAICARKYTSFDAKTGTYTAKSGKKRPCVADKG